MVDNPTVDHLPSAQCIFPENLETLFIELFFKNLTNSDTNNDENKQNFCFEINNVFLYPKYTNNDLTFANTIFVSDEFYKKYFEHLDPEHYLNIIYNLPDIKQIKLKQINGNFSSFESVGDLLQSYLEQSCIANMKQTFRLDYLFDFDANFIEFEVVEIKYKNVPPKNIRDRLHEMQNVETLNGNLGLSNYDAFVCKSDIQFDETVDLSYISSICNFKWYYACSQDASAGILVNNEVEVEFEMDYQTIAPKPKPTLQTSQQPTSPQQTSQQPTLQQKQTQICEDIESTNVALSKEEMRRKRMEYFAEKSNH